MATLQSTGIGSGLDVSGIVTKLVAAERGPKQTQITKGQVEVATRLSAMGSLKGALGGFQSSLGNLKTTDVFSPRSATSGDTDIFTVSASASATPSSYDVEVANLATAQQLSSDPFPTGAGATVGTGLLKIDLGTKSFSVNITTATSTLAAIRDAINGATDNVGVRAAIVNATDGAHLVLTSAATGAVNKIKVTASEGDGGLGVLTYDAAGGNTANYKEVKQANDAVIFVAGFEKHSASNTITDAIDGVTLTLIKADLGNPVSLDVALDSASVVTRITNFVTQYNNLASTIGNLQSFDPALKKAGPLLGDAMVRGIESTIRGTLVSRVDGGNSVYQTLSSIGITTKKDGTLAIDDAKVKAAIAADPAGVAYLFGSANGVAVRLDAAIAPHLAASGDIATRNAALDARTAALTADQTALDARMAIVQQRFLKQFTALDSLLANMQNTSSFLSQQLANLPGSR
jgi:flagellar hook-associated protein 2